MPRYQYKGTTSDGKTVRGILDMKDEDALLRRLRADNVFPTSWRITHVAEKTYRLKAKELAEFSREMHSMIGAGIPIVKAIDIMRERDIQPRQKAVYDRLFRTVNEGHTLGEAMEEQGRTFPLLMINLFKAGEAGGQLEQTTQRCAQFYEREHRLHSKVTNAMIYPIILLCVTVLVVIAIFTLVLPSFFKLFGDIELPAITSAMIAISNFLIQNWMWVLIGILVFVALIGALLAIPSVALFVDHAKLKIPVAGKLLRIIYTSRFAGTLSSMYSSGLPMLSAVRLSASTVGNRYIASQFEPALQRISDGGALSEAIAPVEGFDKKLISSIRIGEETGRLDSMLQSIADSFDYEAEMATARLVTMMEPIMIVIMAVVVGTIIVSVMLPLLSLYQNLSTGAIR